MALRVGQRNLPAYAHRFAPKLNTQPQLLACLVLKVFYQADYRGIVALLHDAPEFCAALGLRRFSAEHF